MKANVARLGYVGRRPGTQERDSDSWFTPPRYLVAARSVLGRIDLDPFSSDVANLTVQAAHYYTERDDAFKQSWMARSVFCNPPYGKLCRRAVEKLVEEFRRGSFESCIVLVNNATETQFFQLLLREASAVCFTNHRIAFYNADGKRISGNTRGQALFYLATNPNTHLFRRTFTPFGKVLSCK
jgi:phage N-6-adenine-methyltransferase